MERKDIHILDAFSLKLIAVITMTIDHIGGLLFPQNILLRVIGRLAFPIYCFMLVIGFRKTSNIKKYIGRLFLFALISEIPFDIAFLGTPFNFAYQNVFFTLLIGIMMLEGIQILKSYFITESIFVNEVLEVILLFAAAFFAEFIKTDYGFFGIIMIYIFYKFEKDILCNILFQAFINIFFLGGIQGYAVFAMLPISLYNEKQGINKFKYFFYWYYPLHLLCIWLISFFIC